MKTFRTLIFFLFLICSLSGKCQMVYEVSNPGVADVKYCVVKSPIFADVIVFKAPNPSYPEVNENLGVWYFCPNQSMAKITVCRTDEVSADLKVYFTDSLIFAQWNNARKKTLMNPKNYKT